MYKYLDYPKAKIQMICSTEEEKKYRLKACEKEPETVSWIESFPPQSIFFDVGANVGSYSLIAAKLGHKVYAFEPNYKFFTRLSHNIRLNFLDYRIRPFNFKLSHESNFDSEGNIQFKLSKFDFWPEEIKLLIKSGGLRLSCYLKIDVDGEELDVLQGAYLGYFQGILVEVTHKTKEQAINFMKLHGFNIKSSHLHDKEIHNYSMVENIIFEREYENFSDCSR